MHLFGHWRTLIVYCLDLQAAEISPYLPKLYSPLKKVRLCRMSAKFYLLVKTVRPIYSRILLHYCVSYHFATVYLQV